MFYETAHTFVAPMIKAWWRPKVTGLENVPETGPVIIAANHLANVDSFLVPVVKERSSRFTPRAHAQKRASSGVAARVSRGSKNTRERPSSPWGSWEPRSFSFPEKPSPARVARNSRCASAPPSTSATSIVPCLKTAGAARSRTE